MIIKRYKSGEKEYNYGRLDRDINATINILNRAGWGTPFAPPEVEPLLVRASSIVEGGTGCLPIHR